MMPRPLLLTGLVSATLLSACTKESGPLQLYFIGSTRFISGNRTGVSPGDTLATRIFATADSAGGIGLKRVRVTVTYSPTRLPFVYPSPITAFVYTNLPTGEQITYLDTTFNAPYPRTFLLTSVFGARTTSGSERWEYTATDAANPANTSTRSFVATVRNSDSLAVYHNYLLRLKVPARGVGSRRFIQFKPGLVWPAYTVLGTSSNSTPNQQALTDLVQSVDGLRLYSPSVLSSVVNLPNSKWPTNDRRTTQFHLTTLNTTGFSSQQDTIAIRQQFTAPTTDYLSNLAVNQVYAFRTGPLNGERPTYGLLRVVSVPGGTTAGLQLEVRVAKQPL